jgi:hypothetical protein
MRQIQPILASPGVTSVSESNCCNQAFTLIEGWAAPAWVNECNGDLSTAPTQISEADTAVRA